MPLTYTHTHTLKCWPAPRDIDNLISTHKHQTCIQTHTHNAKINAPSVIKVYKEWLEEMAQRRYSTSLSPCSTFSSVTYIVRAIKHWFSTGVL